MEEVRTSSVCIRERLYVCGGEEGGKCREVHLPGTRKLTGATGKKLDLRESHGDTRPPE